MIIVGRAEKKLACETGSVNSGASRGFGGHEGVFM
jgi:hypothetical protein